MQLWPQVQLVCWEEMSRGTVSVAVGQQPGTHRPGEARWGSCPAASPTHSAAGRTQLCHWSPQKLQCSGKVGRHCLLLNPWEVFELLVQRAGCVL